MKSPFLPCCPWCAGKCWWDNLGSRTVKLRFVMHATSTLPNFKLLMQNYTLRRKAHNWPRKPGWAYGSPHRRSRKWQSSNCSLTLNGDTLCSIVAAFPENYDFCTHRIDFPGTNSGMMVGWASPTSNPWFLSLYTLIWDTALDEVYWFKIYMSCQKMLPSSCRILSLSLYFKGFVKRLFHWFILLSVYLIESVYTLFKCPLLHLLCHKLVLKRALIFLSAGLSFR